MKALDFPDHPRDSRSRRADPDPHHDAGPSRRRVPALPRRGLHARLRRVDGPPQLGRRARRATSRSSASTTGSRPSTRSPPVRTTAEAAASWLIEHAAAEFGTDRLLVGGESAGAYLSLLTMVRLRDRLGGSPPFRGVDLCYGALRPRRHAECDGSWSGRCRTRPAERHEPTRSTCPASAVKSAATRGLAAVGRAARPAADACSRWAPRTGCSTTRCSSPRAWPRPAAPVELAVYPEGPHGIESAPTALGKIARGRIYGFLGAQLDQG